MPVVDTQTRIDCDADRAFAAVCDFERYPQLTDALCSTERDEIDAQALVLRFDLIDGDFEQLSGAWRVEATPSGCCVRFSASFDFGIPTLASLIDPLACKTLAANVHAMLDGLFAGHTVVHAASLQESVA